MKILQINKFYPPWLGGVEKIVQDITLGLNKRADFRVDVLACRSPLDKQAKKNKKRLGEIKVATENSRKTKNNRMEETDGGQIYRAAARFKILGMPLSLDFFRLLFKLEKNYDALLFHHPFPLAFLALPFLKNKRIFIWYHSDIVRQKIGRLIFQPFINLGLKKAEKIFVSGRTLPAESRFLKKYADKCEVVPFGLPDEILFPTADARSQASAQAQEIRKGYGTPLILAVGRLVYYKGFEYLIKALTGSSYRLLIIGAGPERKKLLTEINQANLNNQVIIIPPVPDLIPYYLASDLFVLPSTATSEAYGIVQAEAMACGRPVINTNLPTPVKEVSVNGQTGLTVAPKNPLALRQAIDTIMSNEELRQHYGDEAEKKARRDFSQANFFDKLENVFRP